MLSKLKIPSTLIHRKKLFGRVRMAGSLGGGGGGEDAAVVSVWVEPNCGILLVYL